MEKKKNADFIIPASHFSNRPSSSDGVKPVPTNGSVQKQVEEPIKKVQIAVQELPEPQPEIVEELVREPKEPYQHIKKIQIKTPEKRVSGLSLSSIKIKKEHENIKAPEVSEEDLPKDAFTEETMQQHWDDFVDQLENQGKKILASNFQTDVPKLKNETTIWIELPNGTMKKEIEREQSLMMDYLKQKLNNYSLTLHITVNEEVAKKFAFTPAEKYEKLKEKNPAIEMLRKEFDLDF